MGRILNPLLTACNYCELSMEPGGLKARSIERSGPPNILHSADFLLSKCSFAGIWAI
jgi:hypothetical protein